MLNQDKDVCSTCGSPTVSKKAGSLTQWISVCSCNSESLSEQSLTLSVAVPMCARCNKRISTRDGSLTQWIFGEGRCTCAEPEVVEKKIETHIEPISSEEDEFEEEELELEDFPSERYRPLAELGRGGVGIIYLCRDTLLNKLVAVKILRQLSGEQLVSFQKEAKTTSNLKHPNIINVLDFGVHNSAPYMVMDYFNGISLDSYLRDFGTLDFEMAKAVFTKLAQALAYSHESGVFHRDIKPSNILISTSESSIDVKLIDFGVASIMQGLVGTPAYMPPELVSGGKFELRSEIYSLGCVLFETLTGEPPFAGETALETISMHVNQSVPKLDEKLGAPVVPQLEKLLQRCLSKDLDSRVSTMTEFSDLLANVPDEVVSHRDELADVSTRRSNRFIYGVVAVVTVAIVIGFGMVSGAFNLLYDQLLAVTGNVNSQLKTAEHYQKEESNDKAAFWYQKAAETNNAKALYELGKLQLDGRGVSVDQELGLRSLEKSIEQNYPPAINELGYRYQNGEGLDKNLSKAFKLFSKGAEFGDAQSQYNLGYCYQKGLGVGKDDKKAFQLFLEAGNKSYPTAQMKLGYFYTNGIVVEKNYSKAVKWYRKAVKNGNVRAYVNLGFLYLQGFGVLQNTETAVEYFRKAAALGDTLGQYNLGTCYIEGTGVLKDEEKGFRLVKTAAENGEVRAMISLAASYYVGKVVDKDNEKAFGWYLKAAKTGNSKAQYRLGMAYYRGIGTERNYSEAFKWFKRSSDNGNLLGRLSVATCYLHGIGTKNNTERAVEMYRELTEKDQFPLAWYKLGDCYYDGFGVKQSIRNAIIWYQRAASGHVSAATEQLGFMSLNGIGVVNNQRLAYQMFKRAAEQDDHDALLNVAFCQLNGVGTAKDTSRGFELYQRLANQGCVHAMKSLARCYTDGIATSRDSKKAFELYQTAARYDDKKALLKLAELYKKGIGVRQDIKKSNLLLKRAQVIGDVNFDYALDFDRNECPASNSFLVFTSP